MRALCQCKEDGDASKPASNEDAGSPIFADSAWMRHRHLLISALLGTLHTLDTPDT